MPRHLPSLHPHLTPVSVATTTGTHPTGLPTLAEVVAPHLPRHGSEDTAPMQIEILPEGTPADGVRLRERHTTERPSNADYADLESRARAAAHASLDLHDMHEIIVGWNDDRVPVLASLGKVVALEAAYLTALAAYSIQFKRRCFLRIQRIREEHAGYAPWWVTWIRIVRIE